MFVDNVGPPPPPQDPSPEPVPVPVRPPKKEDASVSADLSPWQPPPPGGPGSKKKDQRIPKPTQRIDTGSEKPNYPFGLNYIEQPGQSSGEPPRGPSPAPPISIPYPRPIRGQSPEPVAAPSSKKPPPDGGPGGAQIFSMADKGDVDMQEGDNDEYLPHLVPVLTPTAYPPYEPQPPMIPGRPTPPQHVLVQEPSSTSSTKPVRNKTNKKEPGRTKIITLKPKEDEPPRQPIPDQPPPPPPAPPAPPPTPLKPSNRKNDQRGLDLGKKNSRK